MTPMRRISLVALVLAMTLACGGPATMEEPAAQMSPAQAEQEVRQAETDWAAAVTSQDYAKLEEIYGAGLLYAHSSGVVESKSEYMDKLRTGATRYDLIRHESTQVHVYGDAAIAHSMAEFQGVSETGPFHMRLMVIHVWVHEGGRWQLVAHQTTKLADITE